MQTLVLYLMLVVAAAFGLNTTQTAPTQPNAPVTVDGDPGPLCPPFCGTKG